MTQPIKKILVTGANGFIGKNLIAHVREIDLDARLGKFLEAPRLHFETGFVDVVLIAIAHGRLIQSMPQISRLSARFASAHA